MEKFFQAAAEIANRAGYRLLSTLLERYLGETAEDGLIRALRTHAVCSTRHHQLRREARREVAAQRPHAPRHPAVACPVQP